MTAGEMRRYFDYNSWANERMIGALDTIPPGEYTADMKSSHGGLHGTMAHLVWAHQLWLLRWMGQPHEAAAAGLKAADTFDRLRAYWREVDGATGAFLSARLSDAFLADTFTMKTTKGEAFVHTYGEAMLHLVNHSSYHRGQIVTMLRQAGHAPPSTDYILYSRQLQSGRIP